MSFFGSRRICLVAVLFAVWVVVSSSDWVVDLGFRILPNVARPNQHGRCYFPARFGPTLVDCLRLTSGSRSRSSARLSPLGRTPAPHRDLSGRRRGTTFMSGAIHVAGPDLLPAFASVGLQCRCTDRATCTVAARRLSEGRRKLTIRVEWVGRPMIGPPRLSFP